MTQHRPRPDPHALAARVRLWAAAFVAWLAETLAFSPLAPRLRAWVRGELAWGERAAKVIVALAAVRRAPPLPPPLARRGGRRPLAAPRGFRRVRARDTDVRALTRGVFAKERDLVRRAARIAATLAALDAAADRLVRRLARRTPASRLIAVAPPAAPLAPVAAAVAPAAPDTS